MNTIEEISPAEYCAAFLVDFLASVGVVRAELTFSGSGDSGDVDDVQFTFKRNRKPSDMKIEEQWRLAVARHHLLYPEHSIRCFDRDNGDSKLAALVLNFFYKHISESLGDWVNNEGGGGSMTVEIAERSISYSVSYNEVQDVEPVMGSVDRVPLFEELLAASQPLGITAIDANLDFDYEGASWSEDVTFFGEGRRAVVLEPEQEAALAQTCIEIARHYMPEEPRFAEAENLCELFNALYEVLIEETALESREDESEGYAIALCLARHGGTPVIDWSATFRRMDSAEGEMDEIVAPVIHAPANRGRKRRRDPFGGRLAPLSARERTRRVEERSVEPRTSKERPRHGTHDSLVTQEYGQSTSRATSAHGTTRCLPRFTV